MFEYNNFSNTIQQLGGCADHKMFDLLRDNYGDSARFYHDQSHVSECLNQFQRYREFASSPTEVEAAIWYHDAIYDTHANDNEELSAQLAEKHLGLANVPTQSVDRVVSMILATKTHEVSTEDSKLMLDIDLGILGASEEIFEQYDYNIRREYHWMPINAYRAARVSVLRSFLVREVIYYTPQIRDRFESHARDNLVRKIAEFEA